MIEIKQILPFFQTLLGAALALLGVYFVQHRSDQREKDKVLREMMQQAFEASNRVQSLYVKETTMFYKAIRDSNIELIKDSDYGERASENSDKLIAILELYFPFMEEFIHEFCEVETELVNYHSSIIDSFSEMDLETYNPQSERLSDLLSEKISQIKYLLSDIMQEKIKD